MTTRKYNAVREQSNLGESTFNAILETLRENHPALLALTARQIAEIMALCYEQKEYGHTEAVKEFGII